MVSFYNGGNTMRFKDTRAEKKAETHDYKYDPNLTRHHNRKLRQGKVENNAQSIQCR